MEVSLAYPVVEKGAATAAVGLCADETAVMLEAEAGIRDGKIGRG